MIRIARLVSLIACLMIAFLSQPVWLSSAIAQTQVFSEGFESGNFTAWTECFAAESTTALVHSGSKSMRAPASAAGECYREGVPGTSSAQELYVSFWTNFGSTIGSYNHFWRLRNGLFNTFTNQIDCGWNNNPLAFTCAFIGDGIDHPLNTGQVYFPDSQWHRTEVYLKLNTVGQTNGIFKYWVDGAIVFQVLAAEMRGTNTFYTNLSIRSNFSGGANYNYWDDVQVWDGCPTTGAACSGSGSGGTVPAAPFNLQAH